MTFKEFVHKMLSDQTFRHGIATDPAATLQKMGIKPSKEQIEALKKVNYQSLQSVGEAFDGTILVT